jgi:hypothetical protein
VRHVTRRLETVIRSLVLKLEEFISVKEEDGPEPISFPETKTEDEVSCMSVHPLFCTSYRY